MSDKVTTIRRPGRPPLSATTTTAAPTNLIVKHAYLHSAIMIDGKTESTINKLKVPTLKSIEWTPNGFLLIRANTTHLLPSAAVKDTIIES